MKSKVNTSHKMIKGPQSALPVSVIEAKLKDKVLFAEKKAALVEFLNNIKVSAL